MMKRIVYSFALVVLAAGASQAQKIALKKGQQLQSVTTTKMSMEVMGQNIDNESSLTNSVELKEVNADGYLFSNTVKRMTVKATGMGQDMSFDSDKKEDMDGQVGQALKEHIGVTQEIQVDKQGKVLAINESADKKPGPDMASVMSMSGDLTKGQPYPILMQLPGKTLHPGDSWTDSSGTPATIKTVTTYTLKSMSSDSAMVSFTSTLAKSGAIEQNGMEMQMDIMGTISGQSSYETASGLLRTSTSNSQIKGTLGIMGQNAPITANITTSTITKKL